MKRILLTPVIVLCVIFSIAQPTAGLVAYFPMNGNFTDAGPYGIAGTNAGATATTNYAGVANTAMAFANPASTVPQYGTHAINANTSFGINQDFTIVFTAYATSPYIHPGGFYDNNLNTSGPGVWYWSAAGYPAVQFNFRNGNVGTTNGAFPYDTWKHIACVRSGTTMMIYVNGVLNVSGAVGTGTPTYPIPARFGTMSYYLYSPPEYNGLNGKMDELRIYNRALTAAEIAGMAGGALPVKLTSFTASKKENTVTLKWQTQYEQNSSHYIIQRSTDGVNFTDAARVAAAGNSNLPLTYSYDDLLTQTVQSQKNVFYRLQSFDTDGKFAYSQVLALHLDMKGMELLLSPNPAKDLLQVQTGSSIAGDAALIISDAAGRQLYKRDIVLQQGSNSIPVNISMFSKGTYFVRIIRGTEAFVKQFIKTD